MGCIFHHQQMVLLGQCHDGVHITSHTGVVNHDNDTRLLVNQRLYLLDGDVRIIGTAVCKDHLGSFTQESDGRRDKGIGWHYHLVARLQFTQHGAHLQGVSARRGKQTLAETIAFLEETVTQFCVLPVTRHGRRVTYLVNIAQLSS